ncbi:Ni/Fe hydrogenase subunit alpha [Virgisporangium aliadipatigenens]|uniref:Ni/Fe hydrogenase subunit alpha n=1 Tax=Virgisporangium aliadipatigenens TaxID=741659 RepID=A0A8J4DRH1_9ACTN|nr:nickel-dependent hydrogenase large subunit [Virgisporangium aliadipatigenens]GIJ48145.1 Ni/Fe hydrogenase subunit alpha [Virgisporangium aliadipatigenens]
MTHRSRRLLKVPALTRVEGEGALHVELTGDTVTELRLDIYEPPRYFEALLRGRRYTEPPDITARICGICPVAYQMSACAAIEDACGVEVDDRVAELRRLLYCGEWIASHALHIHLLHAPDFLGCANVVELARRHRPEVERGLALKQAGNAVLELVGGRAIHPFNVRLGGFHRAPSAAELRTLAEQTLRPARDAALACVEWVSTFDFPDVAATPELLALTDRRYPLDRGSPRTSSAVAFPVRAFEEHVVEEQVPHSTALHARLVGGGAYLTGPLARYALNRGVLSPLAREAADAAGLGARCDNPFRSIVVRAVELVYAIDEALRIIDAYEPPRPPAIDVAPRAGIGYGATEAPRGVLFHRYELAADGSVRTARIVPPTAQNQATIEADLRAFVQENLDMPDDDLAAACERVVRNHDPCISCATHFLRLTRTHR